MLTKCYPSKFTTHIKLAHQELFVFVWEYLAGSHLFYAQFSYIARCYIIFICTSTSGVVSITPWRKVTGLWFSEWELLLESRYWAWQHLTLNRGTCSEFCVYNRKEYLVFENHYSALDFFSIIVVDLKHLVTFCDLTSGYTPVTRVTQERAEGSLVTSHVTVVTTTSDHRVSVT